MAILNTPMALDSSLAELKKKAEIENAYLSVIASGGRQTVYSSISQIANVIRNGTVEANKRVFPIGDEIAILMAGSEVGVTHYFRIVHHDMVELQDGSTVPGMFLMDEYLDYQAYDPLYIIPEDLKSNLGQIKVYEGNEYTFKKVFWPSAKNLYISEGSSLVNEGPTFEYFVRALGTASQSGEEYPVYAIPHRTQGAYAYPTRSVIGTTRIAISGTGQSYGKDPAFAFTMRATCCCIC